MPSNSPYGASVSHGQAVTPVARKPKPKAQPSAAPAAAPVSGVVAATAKVAKRAGQVVVGKRRKPASSLARVFSSDGAGISIPA